MLLNDRPQRHSLLLGELLRVIEPCELRYGMDSFLIQYDGRSEDASCQWSAPCLVATCFHYIGYHIWLEHRYCNLERMTNSKVESHVLFPVKSVGCGAPLFTFGNTTWVMQFDTKVNTEDEY